MPLLHLDAGGFSDFFKPEGAVRTRTIMGVYARAGIAAVNVALRELEASADDFIAALEAHPLPLVSANVVDADTGKPFFPESLVVRAGESLVGITGVTAAVDKRWTTVDGRALTTADPLASAAPVIASLRGKCDLVILLAAVPRAQIESLAAGLPGADLILATDGVTSTVNPLRIGEASVLYAGRQGKLLSVTGLRKEADGWAVERHELVTMKLDLPEEEWVTCEVKKAKEEIAALQRPSEELLAQVNPDYVGYTSCRECHRGAYEVWRKTNHYRAYDSLLRGTRAADDTCLPCHTTGYGEGGFVALSVTPRMIAVQCESCHGPGRSHAAAPESVTLPPAGEVSCRRCHDPQNSPGFEFESYWRKISH